jgi:cell division protein FtsB
MGYPGWTHSSDRYYAQMMHEGEENKLSSENSKLKKENGALKARNKELEDENKDLKKYIDSLKC